MEQQIRQHNEKVLITLEVGDLVEFPGEFISHWGVYVGMYQCTLSIFLAFLFHILLEYSFQ